LSPFVLIADHFPKIPLEVFELAINKLTGMQIPEARCEDFLNCLISQDVSLGERLLRASEIDGKTRAVSLNDFAQKIFGVTENSRQAAQGLLIARGLFDKYKISTSLPSFRLHYFFRNIEGLWASTKQLKKIDDGRTVGKLYPISRIIDQQGYRVLELLYCEHCGTVLLGGRKLKLDNNVIELLTTDPDIEGIPDRQAARFLEKRNHEEYGIFWPIGEQELNQEAYKWRQPRKWRWRSAWSSD